MKVLSLFDGISCGMVALERIGIKINRYYASEVDKYAIQIAQKNYPDTIQLGDVKEVRGVDLPKIDLLIGGSPCQGFSFAGKQLNFDDPRSKLFFEFVRLLKETQPKYFLLENVKMKKEYQDVISEYLGVEPIEINSALVSAQNRVRLYWTNIPDVKQPNDKKISLEDILEDITYSSSGAIRGRRLNKGTIIGRRLNKNRKREDYNKEIPITQCLEVRATNTNKSNCLTTVDKDNVLTPLEIGRHPNAYKNNLPFRYYTVTEYERLQTLPDGYTEGVSVSQRKKALGNGWTVDVIAHILSFIPKGEVLHNDN
ncbi:MAG: DNA cytosine methyltransferase [Fastidiosipila sp.]|nr:DNA cytosine methyltransferase [Fastidiosipila sp.]